MKGGFPGLTGTNNKEGTIVLEIDRFGLTQNISFREIATNQCVCLVRLRQPGIVLQYPVLDFAAQHDPYLSCLIRIVNLN